MQNKKKTIIFDFDHTLFDTRIFSEATKAFFLSHGISEDVYTEVAKSQRAKRSNCVDFFELVADLKALGYNISQSEIDNFIEQDMVKYLKGPVHQVLNELKDRGYHMAMLSKGVDVHQMLKIKKSGMEPFFKDKIYICEDHKEKIIGTIPTEGEVYFVNDHANETEAVMKIYPEMKFIYVRGPKTNHDHFLDHEHVKTITDVSELLEILK